MSEPLEARERRPPPRIPGYLIQGVLGSGATSVVYRAVQLSIERTVALKVLHAEALRSARAVKRLQREARTAARLKHPNIISAIDMGRAGDTWWFAMELVEGDSLAELLDLGGRFSERRALDTFIPLCAALQYASQHGVVHRDVKPANILIEADGRPRLVDLGLARVQDDPLLTRTGATLGTPHYISPEQARDPASADVRSDIWSIGASLYHTVCGRPPFDGASAAEILSAVLYGRIPDPRRIRPDLSRGLSLVLRKCLSRDPNKRYFTPQELLDDLERVRERKAPAVKVTHLEPLDPRARRSDRRMLGIAGALVALLVVLFAWRPWQGEEVAPRAEVIAPWPELAALREALETDELSLASIWAQHASLCVSPREGYADNCAALRVELDARIGEALRTAWGEVDEEIARLGAEHAFEAWQELLDEGVATRVRAETGFELAALPLRFAATSSPHLARRQEDLQRARELALETVVQRVALHRELVWQQVDEALRNGAWDGARALVELSVLELAEAAGADARGFEVETLADALTDDLQRFQTRKLELESEWRALDGELSEWLLERSEELRGDLNSRRKGTASELFARELEGRLAPLGLDLEYLPRTFEARFRRRFEEAFAELAQLEDELLQQEAEDRLQQLDLEARPLQLARRYEDLLALWRERESESALQPRRHSIELRREEAKALATFLEAAARGVEARNGERESLRVGTLPRAGVLRAGRNVLADGLQLEYPNGRTDEFRLRRNAGGEGGVNVLVWQDLEAFAEQGSADVDTDELALQRVLFRFSEGAYKEARELLDASKLDADDYLVYDVDRRLSRALHEAADEREERREYARHVFQALTSRQVEGDPVKELRRIDDLKRDYRDVLDASQLETLDALRQELKRDPEPATREEFRAIFGADEVVFEGDEVVLEFEFDSVEVGAWDSGDWHFDGAGWMREKRVATLEELEREPVPTLGLRKPFEAERGVVDVSVRFFQPEDSPTDLYVLSAGGFHFTVARAREGTAPVCMLTGGDLSNAIRSAREASGRAIEPLTAGEEHSLRIVFNRARGQVTGWIDGEQVVAPLFAPPGSAGRASLSFRSLEPLSLRAATVRGGRD